MPAKSFPIYLYILYKKKGALTTRVVGALKLQTNYVDFWLFFKKESINWLLKIEI